MSWLNNSLNTIKGQLTTLAQEVLAETAGPGDEEYRDATADVDSKTALELLVETQKEKEELDKLCNEKENEITVLRKQITELQNNKISDSGGGHAASTAAVAPSGSAGRVSKSPTSSNAVLEDSWCWEPDNIKQDNDRNSDSSSSGNGNEMVNITLEEVPLGATAKRSAKRGQQMAHAERAELQQRIFQLEQDNRKLNTSLEELDMQHNVAMQNVLELKSGLQEKLTAINKDYETLKKEHADKFISGELELGKLRKQFELLEQEHKSTVTEKQAAQQSNADYAEELKRAVQEMADLQLLLEKKNQDNVELIERVKAVGKDAEQAEEARAELQQRIEQLTKELEEVKQVKEKKTSESSTSSTGKHSEDEFILVREGDENSSGPTTPPTKEELKDKIVQLENRVSELTLENGSLSLKLQDRELEKELAVNVLKESLQQLQQTCDEQEEKLSVTREQLNEQSEQVKDLQEQAAKATVTTEKLKSLTEEKLKIEAEIDKMKESLKRVSELEKRLVFSEHEKETLQVELQGLRSAQERVQELEGKMQQLTLQNQQFKLNAEAETETLDNSAELEQKLKSLSIENDSLRAELEAIAQTKFRQAIAEEKQEITDLDADDEEPINMEKLQDLINTYVKSDVGEKLTESAEKLFKSLRERLWKVDSLEKSLAQLSDEVLDLQDNKLVWDHEKKTLEADISQYILQCDELMKNNEILLNELENYKRNKLETIPEHNEENILQLESQLEECSKLNRTLEEEYAEMNEKIEELERERQELTEKLREAQNSNERLAATELDLTLQAETLKLEKCNLLFELNEYKSADEKDNKDNEQLNEAEEKCQNLESQLQRLSGDHADLVAALQAQKNALVEANKKREETEKALTAQETTVEQLRTELHSVQTGRQGYEEQEQQQLLELQQQTVQLKQELLAKDIVVESLKGEIISLEERLTQLNVLLETNKQFELQLLEREKLCKQLGEELRNKVSENESLTAALAKLQDSQELVCLQQAQEVLQKANQELQTRCDALTAELQSLQATPAAADSHDSESLVRIAQLEAELLATADLQKAVDTLSYEKNEMIKALQQKHSENMQYYMEIQRLQPIVQQLQQQLSTTAAAEVKPCEKCAALEATVAELRKEQEKTHDQINFLKEKSDILTTNLLTEQTNQKLVQQEKSEVEEQNAVIRKDLERLRAHLLEVEDMHTQETVDMQRELEETNAKMAALQYEVSTSSNAYTSASIRANQHAETLQAQYALLVQQRDELVVKLSSAEDRESKNQAALCNLQCALEQFQNDKENDIVVATQRIRKDLQQELHKESQLQSEIDTLNQQLADANQGLRAASRITDQLEACQQTIAALREEVETLKQQNEALQQQLDNSESSQTDKIDKSLIKSLLIGYVVSGHPNDKHQVLRMISSVLDFTAAESDKVGLNKQQISWLGAILGGGSSGNVGATGTQGAQSRDNLVQAFVQFLEQESQPKVNQSNMPNLLNITQSPAAVPPAGTTSPHAPPSRRTSTASNSGAPGSNAPIPIQPLLLNSNVLSEFAPTRNSSSILKDILSDS